ncbi:MAG: flagellar basal-body rod protein FlgF [Planctomyces sp.]|nr:flagellar basal-body rod protein FlgF [Planctomyces sp.]
MLRGIYAAASGMDAAMSAHETVAQNLANSSVPGYRRMTIPFSSLLQSEENGAAADTRETIGVSAGKPIIDFTPGAYAETGAPLDLAIHGDGFFVVQGPNGPLYTRNGAFQIDAEGQIVTGDGLPLLGTQGPLRMPADSELADLNVAEDGLITVGEQQVGTLNLVRFNELTDFDLQGSTLFRAPEDVRPQPAEVRVLQGYRESSNVSPMNELIQMIAAQRRYETLQRTLATMDRSMQRRMESN